MPIIAKVAVNDATIHFDKLYSYLVPDSLVQGVQPGGIVLVPFGRGDKPRMAVVLAVQNEDAHTVATTVLVYQQYPRERQLAVLLAAAVKYHQEIGLMQQVEDKSLKQALAQAPEEMSGIQGMFQTVLDMLNMTPQQLQAAVARAQRFNVQRKTAEAVARTVKHQLNGEKPAQK